jgi:hypothetical protein
MSGELNWVENWRRVEFAPLLYDENQKPVDIRPENLPESS